MEVSTCKFIHYFMKYQLRILKNEIHVNCGLIKSFIGIYM